MEPRPTILFVCCSVLVIAACILGLGGMLGSLGLDTDLCSLLGVTIFLPFALGLGVQQYRATFRRALGAAKFAAVFFYVIAALSGFGYVTNVGEAVLKQKGESIWWWAFVLWPLLAASLVTLVLGWQNWIWFKKLKEYYAVSESSPPGGHFTLRELFLGVTVLAIIASLSTSLLRDYRPPAAIRVTPEESGLDLPEGASFVSYARGYRGTMAYEFSTDEESFRTWVEGGIGSLEAQAANEQVREITQRVEIPRYTAFSQKFPGDTSATVSDGLEYSWSSGDRGVSAVFDRTTNRAYYFYQGH